MYIYNYNYSSIKKILLSPKFFILKLPFLFVHFVNLGLVLANLRPDDALWKLTAIICRNQSSSTEWAEAMKNQGVQFTEESYTYTLDFTTCFKDNFQQPVQKNVLDFLLQSRLKFYPERVIKTIIAYMNSISKGKPERALLDMTITCFCTSH